MNKDIYITIRWSEEDDAFLAEAPNLPGCISHGGTRQEALEFLEEVIVAYQEFLATKP